jgi:myo-inositol-1-phosphate synthase
VTAPTGVWLVGGRGSVAVTTITGAAALRAGLTAPTGCVSATEPFVSLPLPPVQSLVFGGHDITQSDLPKRAEKLADGGVLPPGLPGLVRDELLAADAEIRPAEGKDIDALTADLVSFRERHGLARVVVINVASTEPRYRPDPAHASWESLRRHRESLPDSSRYACAALLAGCPYVDFTPSTGIRLPGLDELARARGLPYAGSDGKTGETLVKSVLAPMFTRRALRVRSWSGTNLLGGGDGANLADPARAAAKAGSKARVLGDVLADPVEESVHIQHVADLGEWKTAWDHVTFEGFLGARMTLQFTWQGCDSALAAPLVLDLARFMAFAHQVGARGPVPELAFFFKDPIGSTEHSLERQYAELVRWAVEAA